MRLKIVFELRNGKAVPFNRKSQISNWLCNSLEKSFSNKEECKNRYVFSDLYIPRPWKFDAHKGIISLSRRAILKISFINDNIDFDVFDFKQLLNNEPLKFGNTFCYVTNVIQIDEIQFEMNETQKERFEAISPVVVTELRNGKPWYLEPSENKFYEKIETDLIDKYRSIYDTDEKPDLLVEADFEKTRTRKIAHAIKLEEELIRGYKINFSISGSEKIIQLAYACGIGEKNDFGFGMLEVTR